MQYISIKQKLQNDGTLYVVNAISLKNKNRSVVQKIPHPLGSDILAYKTLEEAKEAITRAGFSYILPDGKKESVPDLPDKRQNNESSIDEQVYEAIKNKINSSNSNVSAAAILAISEFPKEETFDILFEKIGEENDLIRKNAISGICRYGRILADRIVKEINSTNWVVRNSLVLCMSQLALNESADLNIFISPLISLTNDPNPVVQANALASLGVVYQELKKRK